MKKLSDRFQYYSGILCATGMNVDINDLVHISALLEAEEQGLLLKLPCKVGTTYWTFDTQYWIDEKECKGCLNYCDCDIETFCVNDEEYPSCMQVIEKVFLNNLEIVSLMKKFGKTVFLTKEEALQKLKELENE